jgi:lipid-binding SYLF domain-containing protein
MKRLGFTIAILLLSSPIFAADTAKVDEQLQKSAHVISEIMGTPDKRIPDDLLAKAVCVGVVPSELKFAIGVGGTYGRGVLVCRRGGNGPWGAPSLFTLGGGSFGLQIGGKATDVVFIVMNPEGARKLVQDKVQLGADVAVAAGPVGRTAQAATDVQLHAEVLSYSRSRGLFAGVSLEGAVFKQVKDDNRALYGRDVTAEDILIRGTVHTPPAARQLDAMLTKYSPKGGSGFRRV